MPTGRFEPEILQVELISDLVKINNPLLTVYSPNNMTDKYDLLKFLKTQERNHAMFLQNIYVQARGLA